MPRKIVLSDQTAKKLIKEVKRRQCLWNPEHDRYNDRYQMAKAWLEIADIMQLPEERLRIKWKNLRDLFKKEVKRFGPVEQYSGKWRHFEIMKFINRPTDNVQRINIEAKEEINDVEDDEFEFHVEDEQEPEEISEAEVYLEETLEEDPIPDKRAKLSDDEDYDVMFLKSLAPYFKELDPIRKLVVRSKMQDMLLNELAAQTSASQFSSKKS